MQRTLFTPPKDLQPESLYHTVERGAAVADRARITLEPHTFVTTNTFFGRFPASYWQRWTRIERITVQAEVQGTGRVHLMASDSTGEQRAVSSARVSADTMRTVELAATLDRFVDGGALWLDFAAAAGRLTVADVRWRVGVPGTGGGTRLVICTFNRADDCLETLLAVSADKECLAALDTIYVVDQGDDPLESRTAFAPVRATLGAKLRYLRQPNLGGAGGFARGLHEASADVPESPGVRPPVLLMDDDIVLEPDTVCRLTGFAALTAKPTIVGGQMLQLLHPERLHVSAEYADLAGLRAGRPTPGAVHDADMTTTSQDARVDAEYNGWWSCLIPQQVVAEIGYPLPVFFQWDDIEYGLRARAAGHPTVTLPGAGVWHADFSWKDWDDWPRYFSVRNALIVGALHGNLPGPGTAVRLFTDLCQALTAMRYGLALTLLMAVEDFLKGPSCLADGGVEALATIRKVRAQYPETVRHPAFGAPEVAIVPPEPTPSRPGLVLVKRMTWHLLGRSRGQAAIKAGDDQWWHASLFESVVATDPSQTGVKVRTRDRALLRHLTFRGLRVLWRLVRHGDRLRRSYRAAMPELTGRENWTRLFDLAD
nr:glycosyltransferase [Amycolatopsis orientalis]